jgi:DNA-binding response OmpR family regulator
VPGIRALLVEDEGASPPFLGSLASLVAGTVEVRSSEEIDGGAPSVFDEDLVVVGRTELTAEATSVLSSLHRRPCSAPVVVVAVRCDEPSRVGALIAGADDVLTVPFGTDEFVARAGALLRRAPRRRFGPLVADPLRRVAFLDGAPLALTAREFDILFVLMKHAGEVVSRREITAEIDRANRVTRRSNWIAVYINSLRRKLGKSAALIKTVRGAGFKLDLPPSS